MHPKINSNVTKSQIKLLQFDHIFFINPNFWIITKILFSIKKIFGVIVAKLIILYIHKIKSLLLKQNVRQNMYTTALYSVF